MKFRSIRHKLVFSTALLVTVLLALAATASYLYFRSATQKLIGDQQFSMISTMAGDLDRNIEKTSQTLQAVAGAATSESLQKREAWEKWLADRFAMRSIFNHGLFVFDKALEGFEGTGETINSRGKRFLVSFKRLKTTGWVLAANYHTEEAFAPITRFRNYFLMGTVVVLLIAIALAWKLGGSFARPVENIVGQLKRLAEPDADRSQRLDTSRSDEFGTLAASFNALLDEILQGEKDLKMAQLYLYQSEKMASVGQLPAGVAHEINNPIGFINSNLGTLKSQVRDLLTVMAAYEQAEEALADHLEKIATISQAKLAADLDFLRVDIEALIAESLEGARRVKAIVDNLRDFSKLDTAEWQAANLENGLESTLSILSNEIRGKAEIVKEFAGLPEVECIASQINQVFMNLLLNAAQAIVEQGTIRVRTGFDDNNVWVEIEDNGAGIKPEHLRRVFDPFFTTKAVGKGTGLGTITGVWMCAASWVKGAASGLLCRAKQQRRR